MNKSTQNEILTNANAVNEFLKGGIKTLGEMRKAWYQAE
jgi:hypothetical protein